MFDAFHLRRVAGERLGWRRDVHDFGQNRNVVIVRHQYRQHVGQYRQGVGSNGGWRAAVSRHQRVHLAKKA
ncbi:hypothetical protein ACTSKR_16365 [Chitinibacteraceae bacterium HSL-7]